MEQRSFNRSSRSNSVGFSRNSRNSRSRGGRSGGFNRNRRPEGTARPGGFNKDRRSYNRESDRTNSFIKRDFLETPTVLPERERSFNRDRNTRPESVNRERSFGRNQSRSFGRGGSRSGGSVFSSRSSFGRTRFSGGRSRGNRFATKINPDQYIASAEHVENAQYTPKHKFIDFKLDPVIIKNITEKNYVYPTKIQDNAIPYALEGKDVLGLAATGSGKTAAFLLPLINKVLHNPNNNVLIVCPTRELAEQINMEFREFSRGTRLHSVVVIGGASINQQVFNLRRKPEFIIGTPGRIKDLLNRRNMNLSFFNNVVLDEVDRMLDMGFIDDIKFIIEKLPEKKQSLFFSATMDRKAEAIANTLLQDPIKVQVESQSSSKNVDQDIVKVGPGQDKISVLHDLLIKEGVDKVLIFTQTKRGADRLQRDLFSRGFKVDSIHGDKTQFKRKQVIDKFKQDKISILVATDVAARGLDIKDVTHVINYDEPANYEDYIHRIGRTGRAGKKGKAYTFVG